MSFCQYLISLTLFLVCIRSQSNVTCTKRDTQCPNGAICDPNSYKCVPQKEYIECAGYGDFLWCGANGAIWGECGSGSGADCYKSNVCPSKKEGYEAITCNYPGLMPDNGTTIWNTTYWLCGDDGEELTCLNDQGSVLVGVCGSGSNADCSKYCNGYHGILCASASYFDIEFKKCEWYGAGKGQWTYCPNGTVAGGHCGSARRPDCGRQQWHALQCCNFVYS
eukprot:220468_1